MTALRPFKATAEPDYVRLFRTKAVYWPIEMWTLQAFYLRKKKIKVSMFCHELKSWSPYEKQNKILSRTFLAPRGRY